MPAALLAAGCGKTVIDQGKAEKFATGKVPGVKTAKCPKDVEAKKDKTLDCDVTLDDGTKATLTMHVQNDKGDVQVGPSDLKPASQ